jgi:hypothetical protein
MNTLHFYYLGTLTLFIYNRVILDFFGYTNFLEPNFIGIHIISEKVGIELLFVLLIYLVFFHFGSLINNVKKIKKELEHDRKYYKVGKVLFLIGLVPAIYIQYKTFILYSNASYLDIFNGSIQYNPNIIVKSFAATFKIGFFTYFSFYTN